MVWLVAMLNKILCWALRSAARVVPEPLILKKFNFTLLTTNQIWSPHLYTWNDTSHAQQQFYLNISQYTTLTYNYVHKNAVKIEEQERREEKRIGMKRRGDEKIGQRRGGRKC